MLSQSSAGPSVDPRGDGNIVGAERSSEWSTQDPSGGVQAAIGATIGDYGVSVSARGSVGSDPVSLLREPIETLVARLGSAPRPVWTRPAGAWPLELDCQRIADEADLGTVLSRTAFTVQDVTGQGEDYSETTSLATAGGERDCAWGEPASAAGTPFAVVLRTLAGGAWAWSAYADSATGTPMTVSGTDAAILECAGDAGCSVQAKVGDNLIFVGPGLYTTPLSEAEASAATRAMAVALSTVYGR